MKSIRLSFGGWSVQLRKKKNVITLYHIPQANVRKMISKRTHRLPPSSGRISTLRWHASICRKISRNAPNHYCLCRCLADVSDRNLVIESHACPCARTNCGWKVVPDLVSKILLTYLRYLVRASREGGRALNLLRRFSGRLCLPFSGMAGSGTSRSPGPRRAITSRRELSMSQSDDRKTFDIGIFLLPRHVMYNCLMSW